MWGLRWRFETVGEASRAGRGVVSIGSEIYSELGFSEWTSIKTSRDYRAQGCIISFFERWDTLLGKFWERFAIEYRTLTKVVVGKEVVKFWEL